MFDANFGSLFYGDVPVMDFLGVLGGLCHLIVALSGRRTDKVGIL